MIYFDEDASRIRHELRAATFHLHRRLEARIPFRTADLRLYTRLIQAYYGFYRPLEKRLFNLAMTIPDLDWLMRVKTPSLECDLRALGLNAQAIDAIPECPVIQHVVTKAQVLGIMYVLEGATLGGQILRNLIQVKLANGPETGALFLGGYGAGTDVMWWLFLRCLAGVHDDSDRLESVRAAQETFESFERWLESSGVLK